MKKYLLLIPALCQAGDISVFIAQNKGSLEYEVRKDHLSSTLKFPFQIYSLNLAYFQQIDKMKIGINLAKNISSKDKTSEDLDFYHGNLSAYSRSENALNDYFNVNLSLRYTLHEKIDFLSTFAYEYFDFAWKNTYQEDFFINNKIFLKGENLKFTSSQYKAYFGVDFAPLKHEKYALNLYPFVNINHFRNKDKHIKRGFYVLQNGTAFGFGLKSKISYKYNNNLSFFLDISHERFAKNGVKMGYFNDIENYMNLNSDFKYKNTSLAFGTSYTF